MARYDSYNSECTVLSYKDGLLSRLAHDLKMRVTRFSIEVDDETRAIQATFDATSLEVVCARVDGQDAVGALRPGDKAKIHSNIVKDVLRAKKHPEIRFASESVEPEGDGFRVTGTLDLHGGSKSMTAIVRPAGDRWNTDIELHQPDFGIRPFSAVLGALKIKPNVLVRVSVPKD